MNEMPLVAKTPDNAEAMHNELEKLCRQRACGFICPKKLIQWIKTPHRARASMCFEEGAERQIADAIEGMLRRENPYARTN